MKRGLMIVYGEHVIDGAKIVPYKIPCQKLLTNNKTIKAY